MAPARLRGRGDGAGGGPRCRRRSRPAHWRTPGVPVTRPRSHGPPGPTADDPRAIVRRRLARLLAIGAVRAAVIPEAPVRVKPELPEVADELAG